MGPKITVLIFLLIIGLISSYIKDVFFIPDLLLITQSTLKENILIFTITTLSTVYGINYIQQKQKEKEFIKNIKIIGLGYDIHDILICTMKLLYKIHSLKSKEEFIKPDSFLGKNIDKDSIRLNLLHKCYNDDKFKIDDMIIILKDIKKNILDEKKDIKKKFSDKEHKEILTISEDIISAKGKIENKFKYLLKSEIPQLSYFYRLREALERFNWDLTNKREFHDSIINLFAVIIDIYTNKYFYKIFFKSEDEYNKTIRYK